jgi:hypothetical protein
MTTPAVCFKTGALLERMTRRAEMAATEATEGHWMEMGLQLSSYGHAAAELLRHHPRQGDLRQAVALMENTIRIVPRLQRGTPDAVMQKRAHLMQALAKKAATSFARMCEA